MTRPVAAAALVVLLLAGARRTEARASWAEPAAERPDRWLGPALHVAVLTFPAELAMTAAYSEPQLGIECRIDLGAGLALSVRPLVTWYIAGGVADDHGVGVGGRGGLQWYLDRALAGPFVALEGGDLEAFVGGQRGRVFGGTATFGYAYTKVESFVLSLGLGFGYWHRTGVLKGGAPLVPEIMSVQIAVGWGA